MGFHTSMDRLAVAMGGLYGDSFRFFRDDVESPHVSELIAGLTLDVPAPMGAGEVVVSGRDADTSFETAFYVVSWAGPDAPTLIFHHGSGDHPYHRRLAKMFPPSRRPAGVNLIATNIPHNARSKLEYIKAVGSLRSFARMLAAATVLIEGLVERSREGGAPFVSVSGISLGGWITNMHKAYFDSASEYRPVLAGAAPDHLFRESAYRKMVATTARAQLQAVSDALNFEEDFAKVDNRNVYPLMARYDQYVVLERQAAIYREEQVAVLDYGHVTAAMHDRVIAGHVAAGVQAAMAVPAAPPAHRQLGRG